MKVQVASVINSIVSLLAGVAISYLFLFPDTRPDVPSILRPAKGTSRASLDPAIGRGQMEAPTPSDSPASQSARAVSFSNEWGVLPASAFRGLSFHLLLPGRLRIDPERSALIGIKPERAERVNVVLEGLEKRVQDYESKAAVRRTDKQGEFYLIPATSDLHGEYARTVAAIRNEFADNPPSGEALLSLLFHGSNYSSFGAYNEEISIKDTRIGGEPQTVIETLYSDPVRPLPQPMRSRTETLVPGVVETRYPFFGKK